LLEHVLPAVEPLDREFVGFGNPIHARDVVLPRVARNLEPPRGAAGGRYHPDPGGRVPLATLGIANRDHTGIEPGGGVEHWVFGHSRAVHLPVGDRLAVGAPTKAVVKEEFFLVDPVERAVDEGGRAVRGQRHDGAPRDLLHIEIVLTDVRDSAPLGIKGREQERRIRGIAAELAQRVRVAVEDPVVPPRIQPPHLAGIGEQEQFSAVWADREIVDMEWRFRTPRNQIAGMHQHVAVASGRIVTDDLLAFPSLGRFQAQIGGTFLAPVDRVQPLPVKLARDDPRHREPRKILGRALGCTPDSQDRERRDDGEDKGKPGTSVKTRHGWLPARSGLRWDDFANHPSMKMSRVRVPDPASRSQDTGLDVIASALAGMVWSHSSAVPRLPRAMTGARALMMAGLMILHRIARAWLPGQERPQAVERMEMASP